MKVLLQPSSGKEAENHFRDTIENGVLLESLKDKIDETQYLNLKKLNYKTIKVWGFVPNLKSESRSEWEDLNQGDYVLFYAKKRFFYIAKVISKIRNSELAKELWGVDESGRTWEFIYFIEEGKQIDTPYNPQILKKKDGTPYNENHIIQGAILLDAENSLAILDYIKGKEGEILDEELLEPDLEENKKINNESKQINTPDEAERKIREISQELEFKPVKQRIRLAKSLARDPRFSRLIKEKSNYVCEICAQKPFIQKNGLPYAESHHKYELSKTLIDNPKDMICVCAICHKVLHYGNENSLKERYKMKK